MIVSFKKNERSLSADLAIDLRRYMNAYRERIANPSEYKKCHLEISTEITGLNGAMLWTELLNKTLDGLSESMRERIKQSAIAELMNNNFVEIVKNAMDAVILACVADPERIAVAELNLTINEPAPGTITLQLVDNGGGFPASFLSSIATREARDRSHYVDLAGSQKYGIEDKPSLLGGAGKGVRELIANIDHGDVIEKSGYRTPKYKRFEETSIVFSNTPPGDRPGAVIMMTSPMRPLELISQTPSPTNENEPPLKPISLNLAKFKSAKEKNARLKDIEKENTDQNLLADDLSRNPK